MESTHESDRESYCVSVLGQGGSELLTSYTWQRELGAPCRFSF